MIKRYLDTERREPDHERKLQRKMQQVTRVGHVACRFDPAPRDAANLEVSAEAEQQNRGEGHEDEILKPVAMKEIEHHDERGNQADQAPCDDRSCGAPARVRYGLVS